MATRYELYELGARGYGLGLLIHIAEAPSAAALVLWLLFLILWLLLSRRAR